MRTYRLLLGVAAIVLASAGSILGQPRVDAVIVPSAARVMDDLTLSVTPNSEDLALGLTFLWTVEQAPSVLAPKLVNPTTRRPYLELWWVSEQTAGQAVGQSITVKVTVSFTDPVNGETPYTESVVIPITAVNHAPTPVIAGNLGSPTARIPSGQSVQVNSFQSTDPDGDAFRSDWALGTTRGGTFLRPPVLFGSEGAIASFTVTDMNANIDQDVTLHLTDGLHFVSRTATAYLTPTAAPPPGGNTAPTMALSTSTVSVTQGQAVNVTATSVDANGDNLGFTWLFNSTTVNAQYITTVKTNATTYQSSLQYPTAGLTPGSYSFSVQSFETSTADKFGSPKRFLTVIVNSSSGGGEPGYFDQQVGSCQSNTGPTLVSILPDPRLGKILLAGGQTANVELVFTDSSQKASPLGGYQTGVASGTWDLSQLAQKGITAAASDPLFMPNQTQARLTLSFVTPPAASGEARTSVTVTDVLGCSSTVGFGLDFTGGSGNTAPTAKIRYDHNGDTIFSGPFPSGHSVTTSNRSIPLDASQSTDDGGVGQLSFSWTVSGITGATVSSPSGAETTLLIPDEATGTATVTLTATDSGSLAGSSTLVLNVVASGSSPTAKILYDEDGDGTYSGPFSSGHTVATARRTVHLDASSSEDDGGAGNLTYTWAVSGLNGAALSSTSAAQTILTVPGGTIGTVTVALTVTDAQTLNDTTTILFNYTSVGDPPTALITKAPEFVTVGEEFQVEGAGESGGGSETYSYYWEASCCGQAAVQLFQSGNQARMTPPSLSSDTEVDTLELTLTVYEDGLQSAPVTREIPIRRPELFFAQLAVGNIDATHQFETSIVLINNNETAATGKITFLNNEEGVDWAVEMDGELVSDSTFDIPAGGAEEFLLTGESIQIGWMKLSANVQLTGHLFYRVVETGTQTSGKTVISEVPILPVVGNNFRTALGPGTNDSVAVAIVNVGDSPAEFTITARQNVGAEVSTSPIQLAPNEHLARFLNEILSDYDAPPLWSGFKGGTLIVEATDDSAKFVATIIKTKNGLPLSILPVAVTK